MEKRMQGISVENELHLYLVSSSIKPAAIVNLDPRYFDKGYRIKHGKNRLYVYSDSDIELKPRHIANFQRLLEEMKIAYCQHSIDLGQIENESGKVIRIESRTFYAGKDGFSLDVLVAAKTDKQIGLALGYPADAVEKAFAEAREGDFYSLIAHSVELKKAGNDALTFLAYLDHEPKSYGSIEGGFSESSRNLAKRYQDFVRANNPELARRVEKYFFEASVKLILDN